MEMPPWGGVSGGLDVKCSGPGRRWRCPPSQGGANGGLDIECSGPGKPWWCSLEWGKCIAAAERGLVGKAQQAKARPRSTKKAKKGSWRLEGEAPTSQLSACSLHSLPSYCAFCNDKTCGVRLSNRTPPAWVSTASFTMQVKSSFVWHLKSSWAGSGWPQTLPFPVFGVSAKSN